MAQKKKKKKIIGQGFLGKKNRKNTQCVLTLIEMGLQRKAYCSLCTNTASYGTDAASYGTDTVS